MNFMYECSIVKLQSTIILSEKFRYVSMTLRGPFSKIFADEIILLIVFRQNSDASKLCSVASDE